MQAGSLDRRIELQRRLEGSDENGQPNGAWFTVDTVWAAFKPAPGKEFIAARQADTVAPATFRIRWRDDVSAVWRIRFDGLVYDIVSIVEIGRREGLEILGQAQQP